MSIFIDQDVDVEVDKEDTSKYKYYSPIMKLICIYLNKFIKSYIILDNTRNYITRIIHKCIPEHTLQITAFNTKTNKIQKMIPLLYLFKYYRIPRRLHEIYYSITVWSNTENKYISLFIDAIILSELENKYKTNPYSVTNIVGLLKYTNNVKYIELYINHITNYYNNIQHTTLIKYYSSLAIPNNITVHALYLLCLYLHNIPIIDFYYNNGPIIKLIHNNDYETIFTSKNDIVFSSLDINVVD